MFFSINRELPATPRPTEPGVVVALCNIRRPYSQYQTCTASVYTHITYVDLYNFELQICVAVGSYSPEVIVMVQKIFLGNTVPLCPEI